MALSVKVGTYVGNGATSGTRAITGVGFQPKFMIVWSADTGEIYPMWCVQSAITGLGACGAFIGENGWFTTSTADRFNSFDSDGFTIACGSSSSASLKALNKNAVTFYYLALGGTDVYSGTYTGNNTDNRSITGVGFTPGLVWTMGGSRHMTFKTTTSGATTDISQFTYNSANSSNKIQKLQSDGFEIGTGVEVNENTVAYYYVAVLDSENFMSGQYTGNGSDNRDITDVGFQPNFVLIKGTSTQNSVFRSSDHSGDLSKYYRSSGFVANYIQSFLSNGFQIGTAGDVNTNTSTYYYLAIKIPAAASTFIPKILQS